MELAPAFALFKGFKVMEKLRCHIGRYQPKFSNSSHSYALNVNYDLRSFIIMFTWSVSSSNKVKNISPCRRHKCNWETTSDCHSLLSYTLWLLYNDNIDHLYGNVSILLILIRWQINFSVLFTPVYERAVDEAIISEGYEPWQRGLKNS